MLALECPLTPTRGAQGSSLERPGIRAITSARGGLDPLPR
jgi:hypothetical protein